jgi:hypothetical protein
MANDTLALGVMRFLHERKVRVPDDISIIGYEDSILAGYAVPPLPPSIFQNQKRMKARRMSVEEGPAVDVLVVGAGPAGIAAAIASARNGAKTMLIEKEGYAGGNATIGLVGPFMTSFDNEGKTQLIRGIYDEWVRRMENEGGAIHPSKPAAGYPRLTGNLHLALAAPKTGSVFYPGGFHESGAQGVAFSCLRGDSSAGTVPATGAATGTVIVNTRIEPFIALEFHDGDNTDVPSGNPLSGDESFGKAEGSQAADIGGMAFRPVTGIIILFALVLGKRAYPGKSQVLHGRYRFYPFIPEKAYPKVADLILKGLALYPRMKPFQGRPIHVLPVGGPYPFGKRQEKGDHGFGGRKPFPGGHEVGADYPRFFQFQKQRIFRRSAAENGFTENLHPRQIGPQGNVPWYIVPRTILNKFLQSLFKPRLVHIFPY